MKNKYVFTAVMLLVLALAGMGFTGIYVSFAEGGRNHDFKVVTSFYPMYIAAKNIAGDCPGVTLENLSEPKTGCMHDYQLTTEDMRRLSSADAFIVNGGGIENFLSDVAEQYPELEMINACADTERMDGNAHVWMSIAGYMTQVQTIADGLSAIDRVHEPVYQKNCSRYLARLNELLHMQQETVPSAGHNIVIFHEAFAYIARDCGLNVCADLDLDEERQVSAGEAAEVVSRIQEYGADVILAEELYGKSMCETIQKETDIQAVYLDTCVRGEDHADSYINAMKKNLQLLRKALEEAGSAAS